MTQLVCPVCSEVIVDTVDDFEEALVPIIMHHAIQEEREKIAKSIEKFAFLVDESSHHYPTPVGRYPTVLCQRCSFTELSIYVPYPCSLAKVLDKALEELK